MTGSSTRPTALHPVQQVIQRKGGRRLANCPLSLLSVLNNLERDTEAEPEQSSLPWLHFCHVFSSSLATILSQSLNVQCRHIIQPHPLHTRLHGLHQGPVLLSPLAPDAQHVTLDTGQNAEQAGLSHGRAHVVRSQ